MNEYCHVRPHPDEAGVRRLRTRDLVRYRAMLLGLTAVQSQVEAPISLAAFDAGVSVYEDYLRIHDRRAK